MVPLNTDDVLATTLLTLPTSSADISAPIGPVSLNPGTYAVIFGSGQFGATGAGYAVQDNPTVSPKSDFFWNGTQYVNSSFFQNRYVVYGIVPEPESALFASLLALPFFRRDRRARARFLIS